MSENAEEYEPCNLVLADYYRLLNVSKEIEKCLFTYRCFGINRQYTFWIWPAFEGIYAPRFSLQRRCLKSISDETK